MLGLIFGQKIGMSALDLEKEFYNPLPDAKFQSEHPSISLTSSLIFVENIAEPAFSYIVINGF